MTTTLCIMHIRLEFWVI